MSMARGAAENAVVLLKNLGYPTEAYDLHLNFPGGAPVDGPSAGVAMAIAMASALANVPVACDIAVTGEISARGRCCRWAAFAQRRGRRRRPAGAPHSACGQRGGRPLDAPIRACPVSNIKEVFALAMGEAALDAPSQEMAEPFFRKRGFRRRKKSPPTPRRKAARRRKGKEDGVPI